MRPAWRHGEQLNLRGALPALHAIRGALEKALEQERANLQRMVGVRDSLKK